MSTPTATAAPSVKEPALPSVTAPAVLPAIDASKPVTPEDKKKAVGRLDAIQVEALKFAGLAGFNPYLYLAALESVKTDLLGKDEVKSRAAYASIANASCKVDDFRVTYEPAPAPEYDPTAKPVIKPVEG